MKKVAIILVFIFGLSNLAFVLKEDTQNVDTNAKIKAVFIYNFTKYIEWPSNDQNGDFKIGILGENQSLYNELDKMAKVKKVANRSLSINSFEDVPASEAPHILYIPKDNTSILDDAVKKLKGKSTLIVTEDTDAAQKGSIINFIVVGSRQKFELNKTNAQQHNLKVASALESLAVLVN